MPSSSLFGQPAGWAGTLQADATNYTLALEVHPIVNLTLLDIVWWTPTGAAALPTGTGVFVKTGAGTGTIVAQHSAPVWTGGAAGANAWVSDAYGSTTLLAGSVYKVCVVGAGAADWYSSIAAYYTTGAGSGGVTVPGVMTAPGNSGADVGQNAFYYPGSGGGSLVLTYPNNSNGANYGLDLIVQPAGAITATTPAGIFDDRRPRRPRRPLVIR